MSSDGVLRLVVDEGVPFIKGVFEGAGVEVRYVPAEGFRPDVVRDADCLVVRTRTRCDAGLLEGSRVRLVVTATAGFDHIDTAWCDDHGVAWRSVPGCNAMAVAEWVGSVLCYWSDVRGRDLRGLTIGVVGAGAVGEAVAQVAGFLGMKVLRNDPPRARREDSLRFMKLNELAALCDVVSFHTPLTKDGVDRSFHLGDEAFFESCKRSPLVINAARGGVVDELALLRALDEGQVCDAAVDCWEGEPRVNRRLLERVLVGTPHVAGYSLDGKVRATEGAVRAVREFFGLEQKDFSADIPACMKVRGNVLREELLQIYDIEADSRLLKGDPEGFEVQRRGYRLRRGIEIV